MYGINIDISLNFGFFPVMYVSLAGYISNFGAYYHYGFLFINIALLALLKNFPFDFS